MSSVWQNDIQRPRFSPLKRSARADVLIIGGGIAGLLCAYKLKKAGAEVILAEADKICGGTTKNTTAKITFAHGLIYDKVIRRYGENTARLYLEAQMEACDKYARLCNELPCDYKSVDAFVYSLKDRWKIDREISALRRLGVKAEFSYTERLPQETSGAVLIKNQAQFNPLKFAFALASELPIYEDTKIVELMPKKAVTPFGEILFDKAIIATHFPILNKHGAYFLKMYQHRSYVLALEGAESVDGIYVDEDKKGLSFRNYKDLLLLGGGGHRTGKKGGGWRELEEFARKHYKSAKIVARWAAQDCMTLDGLPYIGRYSRSTPELFAATGFNKWGMSSSMVAADLLCDLILGKPNKYSGVFSPSRSILHPQLFTNAFETAVGLLTPTVPRCPHLGCALKYNPEEHSWDCPCHGSRFTESGELIDNPATDDKRFSKKRTD